MIIQVKQLTYALRLHGIHNSIERKSAEAIANNLQPLEFIQLLLEEELHFRKQIAEKRLNGRARFQFQAELEDWDSTFERNLNKQKLKDLAMLNFYHNNENLIICGKTGEGKTQLAISLGKRLCREEISTQFHSVNLLFEEVKAARAAGKYLKFIGDLKKVRALILDDFGLRNYTHAEATVLMDILDGRYRTGTTIITSQIDNLGWLKLFEDAAIGEAVVDRLVNPSQKIILNGGSYRERLQQTKRTKNLTSEDKKT